MTALSSAPTTSPTTKLPEFPSPSPVRPFRWYHLGLNVDGCTIRASVVGRGYARSQNRGSQRSGLLSVREYRPEVQRYGRRVAERHGSTCRSSSGGNG